MLLLLLELSLLLLSELVGLGYWKRGVRHILHRRYPKILVASLTSHVESLLVERLGHDIQAHALHGLAVVALLVGQVALEVPLLRLEDLGR